MTPVADVELAPIIDVAPFSYFELSDDALGPEAIALRQEINDASYAAAGRGGPERTEALENLISVVQDAEDGWNGHGAPPSQTLALGNSVRLLYALPATKPSPEFSVFPSGSIAFEWIIKRGLRFSIAVASTGNLSWAGIFGADVRRHGSDRFVDSVPADILTELARIAATSNP